MPLKTKKFAIVTNYEEGKKPEKWKYEGGTGPVGTIIHRHTFEKAEYVKFKRFFGEMVGINVAVDPESEMATFNWGGYGKITNKDDLKALSVDFAYWFSS